MKEIEMLWLDDDSPEPDKIERIKGVKIFTAQSCEEADDLLASGKANPEWAIIDLIVPQGQWGKPVKRLPGLDFINHLKRTYGNKLKIVGYSIVMPDQLKERVIQAGASDAFAKSHKSLKSLVEDLRDKTSNV